MLILAFDTTNEHGGASLHRDLECLASDVRRGEANYSVTLFQMVDGLLRQARVALQDLDLIALATGPGSFTGIRVGLAAAQGWAQAIGRPVCGVSVLEAVAEQARPAADWALPILDARRGEFYVSVVRRQKVEDACVSRAGASDMRPWGSLEVQDAQPGVLLNREAVPLFLARFKNSRSSGESVCCVARQWDGAAQALRGSLPAGLGWQTVSGPPTGSIARLALIAHREGRVQAPSQLDALYLRRSDAEMHWKED